MPVRLRLQGVQFLGEVRLAHVQGEIVLEVLVLVCAQLVEANLDVGVAHVVLVRVGPGVILEERVHADDARRRHGAREGHGVQRGLGVHARDQIAEVGAVGVVQVVLHGPAQVVHERGHHRDDAPHDPRQHHAEGQQDDEQDEQPPPPDERGGEHHKREREHRARRGDDQSAGGVELRLDLVLRLVDGVLNRVQRVVHRCHGGGDVAESHRVVRRSEVDGAGDGAPVVHEVTHGVHHGLRQVGHAFQQRGALREDDEAPGGGERDEDENHNLVDHQVLLGELAGLVRAVAALAAQRAADGARDVHEDHKDHHHEQDDRHGEAGHGLAQERQEVVGAGELKPALVRAVDALAGQTSRRRGKRRGRLGRDRGGRGAGGKGNERQIGRHFRGHRDVAVHDGAGAPEVLFRSLGGPLEQHVTDGVNLRDGELAHARGGLDLDGDDGVLILGIRNHAAASEVLNLHLDGTSRESVVASIDVLRRARRGGELGGDVILEILPIEVVRVEVVQVDVDDDLTHTHRVGERRRRGRNLRGHIEHLVHHLILAETHLRATHGLHKTVRGKGGRAIRRHTGNLGVLVTDDVSDHRVVGDVYGVGAKARFDEFHDCVKEVGVLFVDLVDAQAPMGQEVGQVVESVGGTCLFDPGRQVAGFSAAKDALAADLVRVRVEAGALDGGLAREKLQRVLEGTLCSMTVITIGRATCRFAWRGEGEVSDVRARLKALKKQNSYWFMN